jgi:hypothetical protein
MLKKTVLCSGLIFMFFILFCENGSAKQCDRACLENYIDRYMEAMLNNDPSLDLFARDCKFTENGVRLPLGNEGLWVGMSGIGTYKFYVPDIETQQVAFIGTAREGAAGKDGKSPLVAVAIRLKIVMIKLPRQSSLLYALRQTQGWRAGDVISSNRRECRKTWKAS